MLVKHTAHNNQIRKIINNTQHHNNILRFVAAVDVVGGSNIYVMVCHTNY